MMVGSEDYSLYKGKEGLGGGEGEEFPLHEQGVKNQSSSQSVFSPNVLNSKREIL